MWIPNPEKQLRRGACVLSGSGSQWGFCLPGRLGQHYPGESALLKLQQEPQEFAPDIDCWRGQHWCTQVLQRGLLAIPSSDLASVWVGGSVDFLTVSPQGQTGECWAVWLHWGEANPGFLGVQPQASLGRSTPSIGCWHHPQQETDLISLPSPGNPRWAKFHGGEGTSSSEREHSKCETFGGYCLGLGWSD